MNFGLLSCPVTPALTDNRLFEQSPIPGYFPLLTDPIKRPAGGSGTTRTTLYCIIHHLTIYIEYDQPEEEEQLDMLSGSRLHIISCRVSVLS